jgi:hypothetical protein
MFVLPSHPINAIYSIYEIYCNYLPTPIEGKFSEVITCLVPHRGKGSK